MGRLIRTHDWSASELGPPEKWPQGLRTAMRVLLNTGHPIYIFWGPQAVCFYNDAYSESLGPEQHPSTLGMPARAVWSDIWALIGPQIDQVIAGRGATWHENQLVPITRNGRREESYWTYSFGPIDDDGAETGIGGVLVICTETTRQVKLAMHLAASEERLNLALSAGGGVGTWDWDVENDRVYADDRFARLYGVDPRKAQDGAPLIDFFTAIHPDDRAALRTKINATLHGSKHFSAEYRLVNADGRTHWVVAEGRCEFDAQGQPVRFSGVSMDITKQKTAESQLRNSEAHYRSVVSALHEGILVTDPGGRLIGCNPAAERITGASPSEWQGRESIAPGWRPMRDDGTPMPAEELPAGLVLAGAGPQIDKEVHCLDRDGKPAVLQVSAVPIKGDDEGALFAVVTVFTDVTARHRADQELRRYRDGLKALVVERTTDLELANRALEQANQALKASRDEARQASRAKSIFLANMSHEIRTPMNAIIGLTHLLSRSALDAEQREQIGEVQAAARHLLDLIDDILDLSKIEAGKMMLDHAAFSPAALLESAVAMVRDRAAEKGLLLTADLTELPPVLCGDRRRLAQIVINLLSNAVKFTDDGSVRLGARVVERDAGRIRLQIEVQDTGPGISPQLQAVLFRAFEQGDNSLSRRYGGSGLGLALSQDLAHAMGGEIVLASEVGVGSTFSVTVSLEQGDATSDTIDLQDQAETVAGSTAEELIRIRHGGKKVLVAEDNPINRLVARRLLQQAGLVAELAADGENAVALAKKSRYDLVLMDMQMPVIDGLQATRMLRQEGYSVPIIAMTANAYVEDRVACLEAGMNDHVAKPVEPEALYSLLLRWLNPDR